MRFAAAAIAFRARGGMAFGVSFLRPPRFEWPLAKLPRCGGRARPGQVPLFAADDVALIRTPFRAASLSICG